MFFFHKTSLKAHNITHYIKHNLLHINVCTFKHTNYIYYLLYEYLITINNRITSEPAVVVTRLFLTGPKLKDAILREKILWNFVSCICSHVIK